MITNRMYPKPDRQAHNISQLVGNSSNQTKLKTPCYSSKLKTDAVLLLLYCTGGRIPM